MEQATEQAETQQQAFADVAAESAKIEHDKDNPPRFFTMKLFVALSEEESDNSAQTSFDHSPKEDDDVPEDDEDEFADERPQITNPEEVLGESPAAKRARGKRS